MNSLIKNPLLPFLILSLVFSCISEEVTPKSDTPGQPDSEDRDVTHSNNSGNQGYSKDDVSDITTGFAELMAANGLDGAQVAITHNEKLVYLHSFGKADVEENIPVNDNSVFRIASISKPITLMAISRLVSEGKLNLDDFVFGPNAILGTKYGTLPYDPIEESIKVRHLVEHKAGFTDQPYDIMFDVITLSHADLIGTVLDKRNLAYVPGTRYEYSNFGYSLLGRIVEKVTGISYEQYVREEILAALNISDMKIAGNTKKDAFPNEVSYYSSWFSPYSMNVTRMDSHGGWVASAASLAFLAVQADNKNAIPDFLEPGEGISYLQGGSWNHNGALPGTLSVLQVGYPISYVVLINNGEADFQELIQVVRNFINGKTNDRSNWPNTNLFNNQ